MGDLAALPPGLPIIESGSRGLGFAMSCTPEVGGLLAFIAATRPDGQILELGTGTGYGTTWIAAGMSESSTLTSVELDPVLQAIAREAFRDDRRIEWVLGDGGNFLDLAVEQDRRFDLIFADCWPGKFSHLDQALALLDIGGIYIVDDLLRQPDWPPDHDEIVLEYLNDMRRRTDISVIFLPYATGLMLATRN